MSSKNSSAVPPDGFKRTPGLVVCAIPTVKARTGKLPMNKLQRALGTLCDRCPLCEKARREPESILGRVMAWHGRFCPAWKAQERLAAERLIDFRGKR